MNKSENDCKIMVFGVFDRLHEGHIFFLNKAKKLGENLIIVVTPDETVERLKGYSPKETAKIRRQNLQHAFKEALVVSGDIESGLWSPIKEYRPDTIVTGYDQNDLYTSLLSLKNTYNFTLKKIEEDHQGDTMHSSLI